MLGFVLRRVALAVPSLIGLLVLTFVLIRLVPSDPAAAMAGDAATPEQIAQIRHQYGLDLPVYEQFFAYAWKAAHFDFGESVFSHRPVALDISQRLPATLELTFASMLISVALGIPLGVFAALRHNQWPDYALRILSVAGVAVAGVVVAGVVVAGVVVEVEGTEVEVLPVVAVLAAELAPGCSLATTKPMSAVAPAAPTIEARVRKRTRAWARCLASGELWSLACFIGGTGPASWSPLHQRT